MQERIDNSRRNFVKGVGLFGVAVLLGSCESPIVTNSPSIMPSKTPGISPNPTRTLEPTPSPSPTPEPTPSPTPEPTPSPTPEPTPSPTPEPTPSPAAKLSPEIWIKYQGPQVIWEGDRSKKDVYLTMDDGWDASNMESALKIANANGIKMTFLPVGKLIARNPGMYKEIISEKHDVQNHTFTHSDLTHMTKDQIKTEILKARDALWNAVGFEYPQKFMRPPGGSGVNGTAIYQPIFDATKELGYRVLVWAISSAGTSYDPTKKATPAQIAQIEKNVEGHMYNGGISLQHALNVDVAAFPHIVNFVKTNGWNPITVAAGFG